MTTHLDEDQELLQEILSKIAADLEAILDKELVFHDSTVERQRSRPAGAGQVHISFRFAVSVEGEPRAGALLLPLPEANVLAAHLMMVPDLEVSEMRKMSAPQPAMKGALLEIGQFIVGATEAALRTRTGQDLSVRFDGCQGVRADVRPALDYVEGTELVVARATTQVGDYPEFELILMVPALD